MADSSHGRMNGILKIEYCLFSVSHIIERSCNYGILVQRETLQRGLQGIRRNESFEKPCKARQ